MRRKSRVREEKRKGKGERKRETKREEGSGGVPTGGIPSFVS